MFVWFWAELAFLFLGGDGGGTSRVYEMPNVTNIMIEIRFDACFHLGTNSHDCCVCVCVAHCFLLPYSIAISNWFRWCWWRESQTQRIIPTSTVDDRLLHLSTISSRYTSVKAATKTSFSNSIYASLDDALQINWELFLGRVYHFWFMT